ncbi:MAG: ribose-phosphate pyrophosphokinase [Alphaproteobacteria bacterium]|nr:ribose-phosphate pyrophosphokinase [Alphaproteobacteria bacterium]
MKLIDGTSNSVLAQEISDILQIPLTKCNIRRFGDGESFVEILENVRGEDVFIIQSTGNPSNERLMELLIIEDALKRGSARRITAVIPYFGYARQDRKTGPRTPITAKLVADLIVTAGAHRILTLELHSGQIQGFFNVPADNLYSSPVFVSDIEKNYNSDNLIFVSPDVGGILRTRNIAQRLNSEIVIVDKRREQAGHSEVMNVIGNPTDKDCILIDDICDSAGTLCNAANILKAHGAKSVSAYIAHGIFSGAANQRIKDSALDELVVTNSLTLNDEMQQNKKIRQLSIAPLLAQAINNIHSNQSVSSLFD